MNDESLADESLRDFLFDGDIMTRNFLERDEDVRKINLCV